MARPRKKPKYDSNKIMKQMIEAVTESYEETGELKQTAEEFSMSALKVRKLLITAGAYSNELSDEVCKLWDEGKTIEEIQKITGLKRSSVNGYLPYTKMVYRPDELSLNAERIKVYRNRQRAVRSLQGSPDENTLWDAVLVFQGYPFQSYSGLRFSYSLKKGRNGRYNKELIIDRRLESKTLTWSSVVLAFRKAVEMKGRVVEKPKALGDIRGISYVYPLLYRFGVIEVPERAAKKMDYR